MQGGIGKLVEERNRRCYNRCIGIASGNAILGQIGTEDQFHHTAISPVTNLAPRLCDEAAHGKILLDNAVRVVTAEVAKTQKPAGHGLTEFFGRTPSNAWLP